MATDCTLAPSDWVSRWLARLPEGAAVLDVACGSGRHALWLAAHGARVTAVDRDNAWPGGWPDGVRFVQADLEQAAWPFHNDRFDAIVVTNYLHRPLWPALQTALAVGGVLVTETFAVGQGHYGRPQREAFLLGERELLGDASAGLHVLAFEDGVRYAPTAARVQRLCALRLPAETAQARECLERWAIMGDA